ncbi:alpha/beta fold hydrolase [Luteipulveratus flavus]|uniref:Alpha/beta hydrolase n=1 Tax=Luteipulveratus flavus TaxID=3031728 RepID=A0ABT6CGF5_9MICO|nr:alpha/beta hydrolase [Luteipulveratus sp. YIM 133296]MDF8266381.1 alpha/beta hydrolase [Luteipulveratus sp. YIM 133296]
MPTYTSYDDAVLAYRQWGSGEPVLFVPGGPGRDPEYLGDLADLAAATGRTIVVGDPRGTGAPADPAAYTAERLADDLDALRGHLGLASVDLIAHSAGCAVALLYAAARPERVRRLVLLTPGTRVLGLEDTDEEYEAQLDRRRREPWFDEASRAMDRIESEGFTAELRQAMSPFLYGPWTTEAQEHAASDARQRNLDASAGFWGGSSDPKATRAALADLSAPVRIVIGELDLAPGPVLAGELAAVFEDASVSVQEGAGHFPWVDDRVAFTRLVTEALGR